MKPRLQLLQSLKINHLLMTSNGFPIMQYLKFTQADCYIHKLKCLLVFFFVISLLVARAGGDCIKTVISWVPDKHKDKFSTLINDVTEEELQRIVGHAISGEMGRFMSRMERVEEMVMFIKDLGYSSDANLLDAFHNNQDLIKSWRQLAGLADLVPEDIRRNVDEIEYVFAQLKKKWPARDIPDEIVNCGNYEKWKQAEIWGVGRDDPDPIIVINPSDGDVISDGVGGFLYDRGDKFCEAELLTKIPPRGVLYNHENAIAGIPHIYGTKERQFREFVRETYTELQRRGLVDADVYLQGSAVSGIKHSGNEPIDVENGISPSDYDLGIVCPTLLEKARELGLDILHGPLGELEIEQLGLRQMKLRLEQMTKYEVPVNFKVYETVEDVYDFDKTVPFSLWK